MKKKLSLLSAVSLTATIASSVIACGDGKIKQVKQHPPKEQKPIVDTQTIMNISLSSMKEVGDRKVHGVPYLNFKIPINLYNNLEIDKLIRKTQEEKTIIFNNIESFIKNFVKEKIHEKILKINNSLTKKDYNIIFLYPDIMKTYNPRYKCITLDFIVEGKNKATGKVTQKLTVDVSTYGNTY